MKILYSNEENFNEVYEKIKSDEKDNLHVLADFDRTLTYGSINGIKTPSIISLLRDGNHLSEGYAEKAHALFDKYHPMEIDPNMPIKEKKDAMMQWWDSHNQLLIDSGLKRKDLEDIVENGHLKFREGVLELLDNLYKKDIPLVIMSASGAGDAIPMFFEKHGKNYSNITYVVNKFEWDNNGNFKGRIKPTIHSLNKDETVLKNFPEIYSKIKNRKNVILLGDGLGDVDMITGFGYNSLIKIGLLNSDGEKLREKYLEKFDVVLEGDEDLNFVNDLIGDIK
ncbi:hypothetical protein KAS08_01325 [Candidatus Pacearchaeota archaeon]|nr:hypothetical protein [Candidatus Pacearchaeota archaeon]